MTRRAEIAGAGFAGLAAALALQQRGWTGLPTRCPHCAGVPDSDLV